MKNNYLCPLCRGYLNVEENICFSTKTKRGTVGLVYLNPEIGNYRFVKPKKCIRPRLWLDYPAKEEVLSSQK